MGIIKIENLHKIYNENKPNAVHALRGIDLEIEESETVAIMGISGSGKSTLLHIIGCMDKATDGKYYLGGDDISGLNGKELAKIRNNEIGFVLQDYGLIENESVFQNVKLPLMFSEKYPYSKINARVKEMLEAFGIAELHKKKVRDLSGGQKQRVAIARAVVNEPKIILADEPTSALDSATSDEILGVFDELHNMGKTVIMVTHDKRVAERMQRIVYIKDGIIS